MAPAAELRFLDRRPTSSAGASGHAATRAFVLDELLGQLADLVADRLVARLEAPQADTGDEWLDSRRAAEYLGIHRDSLRRLAAERAIPAEQARAGCKLFFRRTDLDAWRRGGPAPVVGIRSRHDG
jgi:excisionase family DNA binding protein